MPATEPSATRQMILNVPADPVDLPGALARVTGWLDAPGDDVRHVVTVNPEFVVAARRDPRFAAALRASALATADGVGIVLAARTLSVPLGPRITGVDLVEALAGLRHPRARLFLLGAGPGVADEAAARLRSRFPGARIAGTYPGSPAARLIRRAGFEWLYRLVRQPWRWRRQLALPQFVALVVVERVQQWRRATHSGR